MRIVSKASVFVAVFGVVSMLISAADGLAIAYGTGAFVNGAATASPPYGLQSPIAGER